MFVVPTTTTIIWCIVQVWYGERAQYTVVLYNLNIYRRCKSLLTPVLENVPKWMYRNGTYIMSVQCTEVVHLYMYRSGRTEVVRTMYRNGHVPNWSYPN